MQSLSSISFCATEMCTILIGSLASFEKLSWGLKKIGDAKTNWCNTHTQKRVHYCLHSVCASLHSSLTDEALLRWRWSWRWLQMVWSFPCAVNYDFFWWWWTGGRLGSLHSQLTNSLARQEQQLYWFFAYYSLKFFVSAKTIMILSKHGWMLGWGCQLTTGADYLLRSLTCRNYTGCEAQHSGGNPNF